MFGFKTFDHTGQDNFTTPKEFQDKARQDVKNHLEHFKKSREYQQPSSFHKDLNPFKRKQRQQQQQQQQLQQHQQQQQPIKSHTQDHLKYGSSPLRRAITVSSIDQDSSDDASIDSLDTNSNSKHQQLRRLKTNNSISTTNTNTTSSSSLFSSSSNYQLAAIYTNTTMPTINTSNINNTESSNFNGKVLLNDVLPKDFTDYYSPDLKVDKFSNGRPKFTKRNLKNWELNDIRSLLIIDELNPSWGFKLPEIITPFQSNYKFRLVYLPLLATDLEIVEVLINSDIYLESKFDFEFKLKTATYIVQQARLRHKSLLINQLNLSESLFNDANLLNNPQYDNYLKFEWRNIIENYLLNLAIESQCRFEFKLKCSNLKKIKQSKSTNTSNSVNNNKDLYRMVLKNNLELNDDLKFKIWQDVQKNVYKNLELDWIPDTNASITTAGQYV
ncbi:hypothetical protein CANARDRAFT_26924 [[Candida] arabinofermentans NRRL YB-2248]|uniref:Protein MTH1 n=1 Tax=[Candida] arabinofermentans NRRL YB-2248 TaxID=983967 RepID=A0A1E4T743_9ASCO|nr:hypothetical protein CANARDRAFT_26924 [[Candida] arabinofermentans NRRL YB-2248]